MKPEFPSTKQVMDVKSPRNKMAYRLAFYTAAEAALAWLLALLVQTSTEGGTLSDVNPIVWAISGFMLLRSFFKDVKARLTNLEE